MLKRVLAARFIKVMSSGRNSPSLIECVDEDNNLYELVVKCSEPLIEKEKSLAFEAIAAALAADLNLPVPEPFIVEFDSDFIEIAPPKLRLQLENSCKYGFGSRLVTGYSTWQRDKKIPDTLSTCAAQIIVFDQIIENSDRRPINPNCQFLADNLLIYDHEMAFTRTLFWVAPWEDGGMKELSDRTKHIFAGPYFDVVPSNLSEFANAWKVLNKTRFNEYKNALPTEWVYDANRIDSILKHLSDVQDNIDLIVSQSIKVLSS